ncbi:MAG: tetratricopeptide repeat protein [Proteobacteria bacterium]|nr:tetratricopeptide repeat protein [Pseudomonadota bacterium]
MPELSAKTFKLIVSGMVALAAIIYVNNVIVLPSLRAPDGYGHFTYIWHLAATGTIPWATEGWSFFHPPVYYAFMASLWKGLTWIDPVARLKIGTGIIAFLGIAQAGIAYVFVKRALPDNRIAHLLAIGIMLFLPLQMFSAGYLGNERLNAVFCGTSLLVLMWVLERPVLSRGVVLGLLLGVALLVKFTAIAIVSGCFAALFFSFLQRREYWPGFKLLLVVGLVMLSVSSWFYVRNVVRYGNPIQMSRETEMVQRVEHSQTKGKRTLAEYLLFDPLIVTSPQWPRGIPIYGKLGPYIPRSSLRESVWTGIFTNAWFDGIGGQVIPIMGVSPAVKHSGQLILTLALVPTVLVLIGLGVSIRKLWREGWDDLHGALLITFTAMMTIFVYGTKMVVLHAAVKATYMTPVSVIFAFYLAHGFDFVAKANARAAKAIVATCVVLVVASVTVFSLGAFVGRGYLTNGLDNPTWLNVYGIIRYAGGYKERALEMFEASAAGDWHLGHENVAAMALEAGDPRKAIRHLRKAVRLQPTQSFGLPADRMRFDNASQAEYSNLLAVSYHQAGNPRRALRSAVDSVLRRRSIPEAHYNLGILQLIHSRKLAVGTEKRIEFAQNARDQLQEAWEVDPGFREALAMKGVAEAVLGNCDLARSAFEMAEGVAPDSHRIFPNETGTGDMHTAGIHRRQRIRKIPAELQPDFQRRRCMAAAN